MKFHLSNDRPPILRDWIQLGYLVPAIFPITLGYGEEKTGRVAAILTDYRLVLQITMRQDSAASRKVGGAPDRNE